jgi:hypothetical protein
VTLRAEVVDLIGLNPSQQIRERGSIVEISVMEMHVIVGCVSVFIDAVEALSIQRAGPTYDSVNLVTLGEEQLGEIRAILTGDAGDQGFLHR